MSTAALASTSLAPDAASAMARVAALQQMLAQTAAGVSPTSTTATTVGVPTTVGPGTQNFASMLASASGSATTTATPAGYGTYSTLITQAAARYGIDPALLYGVISQESGFNPNAVSSAGAEGLAQIMPANFASLGITNPFDPAQSIDAGARMLSDNLKTFGGNTSDALAAYNAGVGAVAHYGGIPPYAETQNYVKQVLAFAAQYPGASTTAAPSSTVATLV